MAPMEGLTSYIFRTAHHRYFSGVEKYYLPFISLPYRSTLYMRARVCVRIYTFYIFSQKYLKNSFQTIDIRYAFLYNKYRGKFMFTKLSVYY